MVGVSRKSSSSALLPSLLPLLLLSTFCHPEPDSTLVQVLQLGGHPGSSSTARRSPWFQFYSQEVTLVPVLQPGGHPGFSSTARRSPWFQFYSQEVPLVPVLQPGGHPGSSSTVRRSPWFQFYSQEVTLVPVITAWRFLFQDIKQFILKFQLESFSVSA